MNASDPRLHTIDTLREEGRQADALALLQALFAEAECADGPALSMLMVQARLLAEAHAPARELLRGLREQQVARLLQGSLYRGRGDQAAPPAFAYGRMTRFALVVEINEILGDPESTHALFARLDRDTPELARQYAWQALPAVVEAGDVALADRYRGDPLENIAVVNDCAGRYPLFPPPGQPPRVAVELMNLVREARIGLAVLRGQGKPAEAGELRRALLTGLASDALRALAERELEAPGTIVGEIVQRKMAQEDA